jgi:hypothetical protein
MALPFDDVSITFLSEAVETVTGKDLFAKGIAGFLPGIIMTAYY